MSLLVVDLQGKPYDVSFLVEAIFFCTRVLSDLLNNILHDLICPTFVELMTLNGQR